MIWFWVLIIISGNALAQNLPGLFDAVRNSKSSARIEGELAKGHHNCYPCDDSEIKNSHFSPTRIKILRNAQEQDEVCCIPQSTIEVSESCGDKMSTYANGFPAKINGVIQVRRNARAVLHGEYPWRGFIYRIGNDIEELLCAGTAIGPDINHVLTSASCVKQYPATSLAVSFIRNLARRTDVKDIIVHHGYDENNPYVNNIALLVLDKSYRGILHWVKPACTSSLPPMHATSCTVMSDDDYFIDTIVPLAKHCEVGTKQHASLMCSTIVANDYNPEIGAGLFCQEPRTQTDKYFVSGIALLSRGEMFIYTNVSHFAGWIAENTKTGEPQLIDLPALEFTPS